MDIEYSNFQTYLIAKHFSRSYEFKLLRNAREYPDLLLFINDNASISELNKQKKIQSLTVLKLKVCSM